MGLIACYLNWRWLKQPNWTAAVGSGAVLGLAELAKTTLVLLFPVFAISWFIFCARNWRNSNRRKWIEFWQLNASFATAVFVLNAGYGFENVGQPLGKIVFISNMFGAQKAHPSSTNRFSDTWLGQILIPLPQNYLQGIDMQRRDFELGLRSYLRGEWRTEGWWYYYLYGLSIKTPIGTLVLFGMAGLLCFLRLGQTTPWEDELVLLLPGAAILAFVSSQTGFSHHLRYALPAVPFFFVWIGRVTSYAGPGQFFWRALVLIAVLASALSSLLVYPHCLSYFNEAVGGPYHGPEHMHDSNVDWGQDLLYLKGWVDRHPEAQPFGLAYYGNVDPRIAGIKFTLPPIGPTDPVDFQENRQKEVGPLPGWYAVSVSILVGSHATLADGKGGFENIRSEYFSYFNRFSRVDSAGFSIWIYHIEPDECDRVRKKLGLAPLGKL